MKIICEKLRREICRRFRTGDFLKDQSGMGTVEIILIIVVLIALVIIFKTQLTSLVNTIFESIANDADTVLGN